MSDTFSTVAVTGDDADGAVGAGGTTAPSPSAERSLRKISRFIRVLRCNNCPKEYTQEAKDGEEFDGDDEFCSKECRLAFERVNGEPAVAPKWGKTEARRAVRDKVQYWSGAHPHVRFFAGVVVPGEDEAPNYVAVHFSPDFPGEMAVRSLLTTSLMDSDFLVSLDTVMMDTLPATDRPTAGKHNRRVATAGVDHAMHAVTAMTALCDRAATLSDAQFSSVLTSFTRAAGDRPDRTLAAGAASLAALAQADGAAADEQVTRIDISGQYDSDEERGDDGGAGGGAGAGSPSPHSADALAATATLARRTRAGAAAAAAAIAATDAAAAAAATAGGGAPTEASDLLVAGGGAAALPLSIPDDVKTLYTQVGPLVARSRERAAAWRAVVVDYKSGSADVFSAVSAAAAAAQASATSEAASLAAWERYQQDTDGVALSAAEVIGKGKQLLLDCTRHCGLAETPNISALRAEASQSGSDGNGAALAAVAALEAAVLAVRAAVVADDAVPETGVTAGSGAAATVPAGASDRKTLPLVLNTLATIGIVVPHDPPGLYTDVCDLQRDLAAAAVRAVTHSQPLGPMVSAAAMLLYASQRLLAYTQLVGDGGGRGGNSRRRTRTGRATLPLLQPLSAAADAIVHSINGGVRKNIETAAAACKLEYRDYVLRFVREVERSVTTYSPWPHSPQPWEGVEAALEPLLPHIEQQHGAACWLHCFNCVLGRPLGGASAAALFVLLSEVVQEAGCYSLNWSVGRLSPKWASILEEWHQRPPLSWGMLLGPLRHVSLLLNDGDAAVGVNDGGASLLQQPYLGYGIFGESTLVAGSGSTSLLPLLHAASKELVRKFTDSHVGGGGRKEDITITPTVAGAAINQLIVFFGDGHILGHYVNLQRLHRPPGSPQRWVYIDSLKPVRTRVFAENAFPSKLPIFRMDDRAFLAFALPVDVAARHDVRVVLCGNVNRVLDAVGLGSLGTLQPPPAAAGAAASPQQQQQQQQQRTAAVAAAATTLPVRRQATVREALAGAAAGGGRGDAPAVAGAGRRVRMRMGV